jgi:type IV secretion system protein TrbF
MSLKDTLRGLVFKKDFGQPPVKTVSHREKPKKGGESENPYLTARRTWNDHVGSLVSSRQTWQVIGILSLLITLVAVAGVIHVGSQSKFIPYVIEVDKLGDAVAAGPVRAASKADPRVISASVANFIENARLVTPDVSLQRKAIFQVYSMLSPNNPATEKMNEWLNGSKDSSPFLKAAKEMVDVTIKSILPQSADTWQVDWTETGRDRQGTLINRVNMRALVTVYIAKTTPQTTDRELRNNPLGIYVRDFSWQRLQ